MTSLNDANENFDIQKDNLQNHNMILLDFMGIPNVD